MASLKGIKNITRNKKKLSKCTLHTEITLYVLHDYNYHYDGDAALILSPNLFSFPPTLFQFNFSSKNSPWFNNNLDALLTKSHYPPSELDGNI